LEDPEGYFETIVDILRATPYTRDGTIAVRQVERRLRDWKEATVTKRATVMGLVDASGRV
jgi:hypothetical protein